MNHIDLFSGLGGFTTRAVMAAMTVECGPKALNARGIPIAGSREGIENFWHWFKDSKVVDEQGKPLVVYHGTYSDIDSFKVGDEGAFFTASAAAASSYASFGSADGGNVVPAYLSLRNPLIVADPDPARKIGANYYDIMQGELGRRGRAEGRDGIIIRSIEGRKDQSMYVAFSPNQIKSAIGNNGNFNRHSDSLTDPVASETPAPLRRNRP